MSSGALNTHGWGDVDGLRVIAMVCELRRGWRQSCNCHGYPLIRLVKLATFTQEMIMSQKAHQNPVPKHTTTSEQNRRETPITGLSPDDDIGVGGDGGTSKPAAPPK